MNDLYHYEITMHKEPGIITGIRLHILRKFAQKCEPNVVLNEDNIPQWILRYAAEEQEYSPSKMKNIKITKSTEI